jgi:hypothetical protein
VRAEALVAKDAPLKETDFALPLVPAARYSQHDGGNNEIYQYRACMTDITNRNNRQSVSMI